MVKLLENGEGLAGEEATEDSLGQEGGLEVKSEQKNGSKSKRQPLPATYEPDQRSQGWLKVKKGKCGCELILLPEASLTSLKII